MPTNHSHAQMRSTPNLVFFFFFRKRFYVSSLFRNTRPTGPSVTTYNNTFQICDISGLTHYIMQSTIY